MLNKKDLLVIAIGIPVSVLANVIYSGSIHVIYMSFIVMLLLIAVLAFYRLYCLRNIGVSKIDENISEGHTTEKILATAKSSVSMMGRGASRFLEAKNITETLIRLDKRTPVRFLLLHPKSEASKVLSQDRQIRDTHISGIIVQSLKTIKKLKGEGYNIEVRFYREPKYVPIFRVVLVDNDTAYVSFYPRGETGKNALQIILKKQGSLENNNLYIAFSEFYESMWAVARE